MQIIRDGEGFFSRVLVTLHEGTRKEIKVRIQQGCMSVESPLFRVSSTDGESLKEQLRDLKKVLNALPEI